MTWHGLIQGYAIQTRELSDAVASLGHLRPEDCRKRIDSIHEQLHACIAAADEINRYLKRDANIVDDRAITPEVARRAVGV
jgi:hypothetical protein